MTLKIIDNRPFIKAWKNAYRRCYVVTNNRYQYYGAKGIRCLITVDEVIYLAIRDKAHQMKKPQIHRFDSTKDYTLQNCGFIEASEHSRITHLGAKRSKAARRRMSLSGGTRFGEKHGMAKLTNEQVVSIKLSKMRGVDLAKRFNVHKCTISAIKKGRNWSWLSVAS